MLLKREYGLTIEAYTAMLQLQFYKCAACGDKFDPEIIKGKVCVDHDHKTGKLRELLCHRCNVTLGNVNDEVERLEKLIAYLKKHAGGDD
jgi:DNA-directed RNA polymerase subunit RPC12/RpoP